MNGEPWALFWLNIKAELFEFSVKYQLYHTRVSSPIPRNRYCSRFCSSFYLSIPLHNNKLLENIVFVANFSEKFFVFKNSEFCQDPSEHQSKNPHGVFLLLFDSLLNRMNNIFGLIQEIYFLGRIVSNYFLALARQSSYYNMISSRNYFKSRLGQAKCCVDVPFLGGIFMPKVQNFFCLKSVWCEAL